MNITNDLLLASDSLVSDRLVYALVLLDLSAAFNMTDHNIILHRL